MTIRRAAVAAAAILAATAAVGLWAWWRLPAAAAIAVHFNANGDPDGFASKTVGLALMPAIGTAVAVVLILALSLAPRRKGLAASTGVFATVIVGVAAMFLVSQAVIVAQAIDPAFDIIRWLFVAIGVLFAVVGNILGKLRHNYVIGVRTPWTLANERVWDKTHRLTGRLMLLAGVVLALGAMLLGGHRAIIALLVACAAGPALAGAAYSWRLHRALGGS